MRGFLPLKVSERFFLRFDLLGYPNIKIHTKRPREPIKTRKQRRLMDIHSVKLFQELGKVKINLALMNDLDIVAVRIEHPCRIVARIVFVPRLR